MISIPGSRLKNDLFALPVQWVLFLTLRLRPFRRLIFLVLLVAAVMFTTWHGVRAAGFLASDVAMPVFLPSVLLSTSSVVSWGALLLLALLVGWLERTRRKVIERNQHLRRIYQLTDAVARSDTIETIYEEALNALAQSLKADRAAVLLFDADGRMCFKAWRGLSEGYRKAVEGHSPWAADSRNPEPITIASVAADLNLGSLKEVISQEGISALAFIPLVCRDRLLGKFMIYYDSAHEFTPEETQMAQTIASQIAFALERTRAEEELKLYREIFARTTDGIEITDSEGRYLEQNAAQRALLGYSDVELRGQTPAIHLGDEVFAQIASELASSGRYRGELLSRSARRSDGASRSLGFLNQERGGDRFVPGRNKARHHRAQAITATARHPARRYPNTRGCAYSRSCRAQNPRSGLQSAGLGGGRTLERGPGCRSSGLRGSLA